MSIVSATPGTTTDPVEKSFEMAPVGPVVFVDTAGVDDVGALGELRKQRTAAVLERVDVALLVCGPEGFGPEEEQLAAQLRERATPSVVVFNKSDLAAPPPADLERLAAAETEVVRVSAAAGDEHRTAAGGDHPPGARRTAGRAARWSATWSPPGSSPCWWCRSIWARRRGG